MFSVSGYLFYWHVYHPRKISNKLAAISKKIDTRQYDAAHRELPEILSLELRPAQHARARELMAKAVLAVAGNLEKTQGVQAARNHIIAHLKEYGAGREADVLWERLEPEYSAS